MQFSILVSASGPDTEDWWPCDLTREDADRILAKHGLDPDTTEPGDSEYSYLAEDDPESFWADCRDTTASGILDRSEFTTLIDDLGAYAEDIETLGTLGGPANPIGLAPDIVFEIESQAAIFSIRVTPLPERMELFTQRNWDRVRAAVLSVYGL